MEVRVPTGERSISSAALPIFQIAASPSQSILQYLVRLCLDSLSSAQRGR